MDLLKNWRVLECELCGTHHYLYGDDPIDDDWTCSTCGTETGYNEVDAKNITSYDIAELLSNELEHANHHNWTELPEKFLESLSALRNDEAQIREIFVKFADLLYEMI